MPVEKVKVEHKFGIISHSQRLLLEHRLESKSKITTPPSTYSRKRNHYDVNENFVSKFNDSNFEDQDMLVPVATKMLTRAKRRAGIKDGGVGNHVNIPKAWADLTLLAQLNNKDLQEECLEVLITSLSQTPVLVSHIPSLFFLAKSTLHWLRRSGLNQPYLRTGELKLTKMGHLVFQRLYHFYLTNQLHQNYPKEKQGLLLYLSGVSEQQYVYRYFPGALLSLRFMTEVGYLICKGVQAPSASLKESQSYNEPVESSQEDSNPTAIKANSQKYFGMEKITEEEPIEASSSPSPVCSPTIAESIHDITATLWHALDVWRSVTHKGVGFQQALQGLSVCGTGLATESWLDVSSAFLILADASAASLGVLQTFQALAAGVFPRPAALAEAHAQHLHLCTECHSAFLGTHEPTSAQDEVSPTRASDYLSVGPTPSFVRGLKEFARLGFKDEAIEAASETNETGSSRSRDVRHETSSEASFADVSSVESDYVTPRKSSKMRISRVSSKYRTSNRGRCSEDLNSSSDEDETLSPNDIALKKDDTTFPRDVTKRPSTRKERLGTGVRFQDDEPVGDDIGPEPLERDFTKGSLYSAQTHGSTVTLPFVDEDVEHVTTVSKTGTSPLTDLPGLYGWPWELAYLYVEAMTSVCLHGNSSLIRKVALLGSESYQKPRVFAKKTTAPDRTGMGLADLLKFELPKSKDSDSKDWSWRVRFAAMQGLIRISRLNSDDSTKDGMRSAAWNLLMRHHSVESDVRVLEALKLAKVEAELDGKVCPHTPHISTLQTHLAQSLSTALLPQLPPIVTVQDVTSRSRVNKIKPSPMKRVQITQTRPSLRQEILLATAAYEPPVGYNTRMNTQLMAVIEEQWRKQLHLEQEKDETERTTREAQKILNGTAATEQENT